MTQPVRSYAGARLRTPKVCRKVQWPQYWQSATYQEAVLRRPPFFTGATEDATWNPRRSPRRSPSAGRGRRKCSPDRAVPTGLGLTSRPTTPDPADLSIEGLGLPSSASTRTVGVQTEVTAANGCPGWPGVAPIVVMPSVTDAPLSPSEDRVPCPVEDPQHATPAEKAPSLQTAGVAEPRAAVESSRRGSTTSCASSSSSVATPYVEDLVLNLSLPAPPTAGAMEPTGLGTERAAQERREVPVPRGTEGSSARRRAACRPRRGAENCLGRLECLLMAREDEDQGVSLPSQLHCGDAMNRAAENMQYVEMRLRESAHAPAITAVREELQMTFKRANDVTLENLKRMIHLLLKAHVEREERRKVTSDFTEAWSGFRTEFELCISVVMHSIVDLEAAMRCKSCAGQLPASPAVVTPELQGTPPLPAETVAERKGSFKASADAMRAEAGAVGEPANRKAIFRSSPRARSMRLTRSELAGGAEATPQPSRRGSRPRIHSQPSSPASGTVDRTASLRLSKAALSRQRGFSEAAPSKVRANSPGAKSKQRGLAVTVADLSLPFDSLELSSWHAGEEGAPPILGDTQPTGTPSSARTGKPVSPEKPPGEDLLDFLEISREVSVCVDSGGRGRLGPGRMDSARFKRSVTVHFDPFVEVSEVPPTGAKRSGALSPQKPVHKQTRKRSPSSTWETMLHPAGGAGDARPEIFWSMGAQGPEGEDNEDSPIGSPVSVTSPQPLSSPHMLSANPAMGNPPAAPFQGPLPAATRASRWSK
eukprot:GGOE01062238.1.p1 GENE.GGOE01062238.1~~GGOE01062238.1.p1  ORF type:complete len:824 (+),score=134.14 GGOE01062238.1:178-2472(+)